MCIRDRYLTNVVTGKRYIKKLVEDGIVDGWDDPRLVTIAALRRSGYTPESLRMFVDLVGVSKANSSVDYAMLEYCIREDLKLKRPRMMAILDQMCIRDRNVRVVGDAEAASQTTFSFTLKFKALKAGTSSITVKSQEVYDANGQAVTISHTGNSAVKVSGGSDASQDLSLIHIWYSCLWRSRFWRFRQGS